MKVYHLPRRIPALSLLTLILSGLAHGGLPEQPQGVDLGQAKAARSGGEGLGAVELLVGQAAVKDGEGLWKVDDGLAIRAGDVLATGPDTRLRIQLKNGDALHLGAGVVAQVVSVERFRVWTGQAAIYVQPVEGNRTALMVEAPGGELEATGGKLGLEARSTGSTVMAFNNWDAWRDSDRYDAGDATRDWRMLARWQAEGGKAIPLAAGLKHSSGPLNAIRNGEEVDFTLATSPEAPAMKAALGALAQGDAQAKPLLTRLQNAFPGNAQAAYHLGRIALDAEDNVEALRQWQLFSRLDPAGAEALQVGPKMTLLIHETLKDEIKRAVAAEAALSAAPPEPGTVAVLPFVNRGDAAQAVLSKGLTAMVISDLSKVPGIKVLERAKLQKLIEEMQLSESGLVDEKSAIRAGKLMKAEKIMLGDYQLKTDK
ncbi:MAG: CsgG/HfaB family protein [Pseudomonadota bacterium]